MYDLNNDLDNSDSDISIHDEIDEDHLINFEKYKTASRIVNIAMDQILSQIKPDQLILNLAIIGDGILQNELDNIYKKQKLKYGKGICMPTCVSVNHIAAYNSPLLDNKEILKNGDVVKVEMGVHIDGFICLVAKTKYLSYDNDPNKEKIENLLKAIDVCKENIKGVLKVDKNTSNVVKIFNETSKKYGVSLISADVDNYDHIPGLFCYQLSRGFVDSYNEDENNPLHKMIVINDKTNINNKDEVFKTNDVMVIDIMMSTGTGKITNKESIMPSIYIRNPDMRYNLKMKASRETYNEFKNRADKYPCTIRPFDSNKHRIGLRECLMHKVLEPYFILSEKNGEFIAQCKFTAIVKFKKNHYL
jgi:curved DNA binding protein